MRSVVLLLLLGAGLAAGWLARDLLDPEGAAPTRAEAPAPGVAGATGQGPRLAAAPGGGADSLAEEAGLVVRALERSRGGTGAPRVRGLTALASLHAVAGSEAEFLRVASRALAQGASLDDLLPSLREFPPEVAARLLAQLLDAGAGGERFDVVEVGRLLAAGGQADRALSVVRGALPRAGETPDPQLLRLLLSLDPAEGPRTLFGIEGAERWDADTLGVLRALLIEAGQERGLVPFLNRALTARPGDADLLRWLARVDPAAAEARLNARLKAAPDDARAWSLLGDLRRDAGDAAAAFEAWRRAAEAAPGRSTFRDLVRADPVRGLPLAEAWAAGSQDDERIGALADMYLLAGRRDEALRAFLSAHEHDPSDGTWIERLISLDPATAAATLEAEIGRAPGAADAALLGRYGRALAAAGRTPEAFTQVLAAFQKDPEDQAWQTALVDLDARRALPLLERRVHDHPGDASARGALGLALVAGGRREEGLSALEAAVLRGDAEHWYRATAAVDPERALGALSRRARSSMDAGVWGLLGGALRERQQRDEARAAYLEAARLDPGSRAFAEALRDLR